MTLDDMDDPIVFLTKFRTNKDTLYYHKMIAYTDSDNLKKVVVKKFCNYCKRKHCTMVNKSEVLIEAKMLHSVRLMKINDDIVTGIILNYKA